MLHGANKEFVTVIIAAAETAMTQKDQIMS